MGAVALICGVILPLGTAFAGFYESGNEDTDSYAFYDEDQKTDAKVNKCLADAQTCDMYAVTCTQSGDTDLATAYRRLGKALRELADAYSQGYSLNISNAKAKCSRARSMLQASLDRR